MHVSRRTGQVLGALIGLGMAAPACGPDATSADASGGGTGTTATDAASGTGPTTGDGSVATTGSSTDDSTTDPTGNTTNTCLGEAPAFFDICGGPFPDVPGGSGCAAVDLLFVVDGSPSMETRRQDFIAVVGDLLGELYAAGLDDVQAMVVDMDTRTSLCADACAQDPGGSCLGQACAQIPGEDQCSGLVGAGLRTDALGADCGLPTDRAFVDFLGDADPLDILQCLLDPALPGDLEERPAEAMMAALLPVGPVHTLGCNDGFRRNNAMPVVVLLSDEDDDHSAGGPLDWATAMAEASPGGDPVILAMLGDPDRVQPICTSDDPDMGGATPAPRLRELLATTPWGFGPSICSPDYGPIALDMADAIVAACGIYTPPG